MRAGSSAWTSRPSTSDSSDAWVKPSRIASAAAMLFRPITDTSTAMMMISMPSCAPVRRIIRKHRK
ncbi:hypothetical protein [Paracoccus sphaerophysae]|uniref:Uncharacterized protein n=1 Tax=Paracoccus sphaerophysae TaxID=690417 RepID=A0A099FEL3_9RHOB|nr:hypothetical protein [Paracoccus sphaerophysae]KGJ08636.1 hypothetical protein IC63_04310 [Paracoccus sphaerophysae]